MSGFNYFMVLALLNQLGFNLVEETGPYTEIWHNSNTNKSFEITRTSDYLSKEELLNILDQAGLTPDEFLKLAE